MWSFKTCKISEDGMTAEWLMFKLRYPTPEAAAHAAACFMLKEAASGHMVITSLEPVADDDTRDIGPDERGFGT